MKVNLTKDVPPAETSPVIPQVPPPARLPPGITSGNPPLPSGRTVTMRNPTHLLPEERKTLEALGWTEGTPVPSNLAEIIHTVQVEIAENITRAKNEFAIDPTTPPVKLKLIPVEQMTPEQQARIKTMIAESVTTATTQSAAPRAVPDAVKPVLEGRKIETTVVPPIRPAPEGNVAPNINYAREAREAREVREQAVNPKARPAAATTAFPAAPAAPAATQPIDRIAPLTHCPHCSWDLSINDIPEPKHQEKQAFLASILGQQVFTREYPLLAGNLTLTFRTLTVREIDACFKQAYLERERQEIQTVADFWERVNRFRLCLQLLRLQGTGDNSFDHEMPDGLDRATNPNAETCWDFPAGTVEPVRLVENTILNTVLKNETLVRIGQQHCARFNQLVARLEALVDNSDFWKATGQPS